VNQSLDPDLLWIQYSHLAEGGFGRVMWESEFKEVIKRITKFEVNDHLIWAMACTTIKEGHTLGHDQKTPVLGVENATNVLKSFSRALERQASSTTHSTEQETPGQKE
jgi:CO dehydrogenase/acetyl-CoA synthase beta subunit